jgi:intracellular septation protein
MAEARSVPWLRHLVNAAPAVGFLAALVITRQFRDATWVLVGLSVLAIAVSLIVERRVAPIAAFSGGAAILFGGTSLLLHRNDILQMKMTIVDTLFGAALFGALLLKRNPLKWLLGSALDLPDQAWRQLMIRYGFFFWACAVANEIVRRTQTTEVWAMFRVAAIVAAVVFGAAQMPLLMKHGRLRDGSELPEPPEPGF